jgi:hypothetical protein
MKKVILFSLFLSVVGIAARAQECGTRFLGTKTLYKVGKIRYTPVPAGYQPVFINHVGRHGARHLTKDVSTTFTYGFLLKADSAGQLTEKGRQLKRIVLNLQKVEKGNTKSISAEGRTELKFIGERMFNGNANVFAKQPKITVDLTKEIRTKQSADAFLIGLKDNLKDSVSITEATDDINLRFYDESPAYSSYEKDGDWQKYKAVIAKAEHVDEINASITKRLFTDELLKTLNAKSEEKIVNDIWGFATIVYSLHDEIIQAGFKTEDLNFTSLYTCDELKALGRADAAEDFLVKGPGVKPNGLQVIIAAPLLANFVITTDEFIKTGNYNARLRFAHAETISPFAALLGIATADQVSADINKFDANWQAAKVIPLSSNIQWIFYKKKGTSGYRVKILLNEQEAHITGLKTGFPYYKWSEVRKLYVAKLAKLHYKLGDDAVAFLKLVK